MTRTAFALLCVACAGPVLCFGQTDDSPPTADPNTVVWLHFNDFDGKFGGSGQFLTARPWFAEFPARSGLYTITKPSDTIDIAGFIFDADFLPENSDEDPNAELSEVEIYARVDVRVTANLGTSIGVIGGSGWELIDRQPTDPNFPFIRFFVEVPAPEVLGPALTRLLNDAANSGPDYDGLFRILIQLSNSENPGDDEPVTLVLYNLIPDPNSTAVPPPLISGRTVPEFAVRFDERNISNGPAFADAGVDQTVNPGATVLLDASDTFDGLNAGFDPDAPLTFAEDRISYAWTWLDGPIRVDPVQNNPNNPVASIAIPPVLFNTDPAGEDVYTFQVSTTDNVNTLSTSDTVQVRVRNFIENLRPRAEIQFVTPGGEEVFRNELVTLSGATSSDRNVPPFPNELTYFWTQVDELGNPITTADADSTFLPLDGVDTPTLSFQATRLGEFFFRLTVSDGELLDSAIARILVTDSQVLVNGRRMLMGDVIDVLNKGGDLRDDTRAQSDNEALADDTAAPQSFGLCGGNLLALTVVPLALFLVRRRR